MMIDTTDRFTSMTDEELQTLANSINDKVEHLLWRARDTYRNRMQLARLQKRSVKIEAEIDRRTNG